MLRTYNDDLMAIAQFYWDAEEQNDLFGMALWKQWNIAIHRNNGKEPEDDAFDELLKKLNKCTIEELEQLA
jgi:hypothetical protein